MKNKPFIIFYILVAYVFIQFCWWGYHIVDLNRQVYELSVELENTAQPDAVSMAKTKRQLEDKLVKRKWMVIGEGSVFALLLVMGVYITQRAFKKEVDLSRQQSNFLMAVTHELKSPLASIKLYMQTMQKHELEVLKSEEIIENVLNETNRLTSLVDNILLSSQIESGIYLMVKEEVNMSKLTDELLENFALFPHKENINIHKNIGPDIKLNADINAMNSVIINLIDNAVKYSDDSSNISVELASSNSNVILTVKDEGQGISDAEKAKVFNKFYRQESESTRKSQGTGLGLYILKYLVEQHNGEISLTDNEPKGSIFEIIFKSS
ncbi:MAG TPA: HAMP domain-containing histidine kinase [Flavobacteriales bacterium]|nr:HAMP domain-containing histidine kinase [Flavobacteriales bacterium]